MSDSTKFCDALVFGSACWNRADRILQAEYTSLRGHFASFGVCCDDHEAIVRRQIANATVGYDPSTITVSLPA